MRIHPPFSVPFFPSVLHTFSHLTALKADGLALHMAAIVVVVDDVVDDKDRKGK